MERPILYDPDETQRDVDLDDVLNRGLADANFEFRIRALYQDGATTRFGDYSQIIRTVENPLTAPGGMAYVPNKIGTAKLKWIKEANATRQMVRFRRLDSYRETIRPGSDPCTDRSQAPPVFHNHDAWPNMPGWPTMRRRHRQRP